MVRKTLIAIGIGAIASASSAVFADGVMNVGNTAGSVHGGVFDFSVVSGFVGEGLVTDANGHFGTFCMEINENISLGNSYHGSIDSVVINGGTGGSFEPIHSQTAYLYTQFRAGTLSGYSGSGFDQDALQVAMWEAQNQPLTGPGSIDQEVGTYGGNSAALYAKAAGFLAAVPGSWNGIGNVRVVNLYSGSDPNNRGQELQSELVLIPLPAETTMAGLGLLGLVGVRVVRRRRA